MSKVIYDSCGDLAFLTCDAEVHFKMNGSAGIANALETYIFKKENGNWKMYAKSVIMNNK